MCVCYILRHLITKLYQKQEPYNFCEYLRVYFPFKSILINSSSPVLWAELL